MTGLDVWGDVIKPIVPIIGVVVGFFLGLTVPYYQRRRRRRAYTAALEAEIDLCERKATTYLKDRVPAPLYRLPTAAFSPHFLRYWLTVWGARRTSSTSRLSRSRGRD